MPNLELVKVETSDNIQLHGLLFTPQSPERAAVIMIHGVAGNFYSSPMATVAEQLAERGYASLTVNTRGHDWISGGYKPRGFIGAAFETFRDTTADIDAFIKFLEASGRRNLVLLGHSLGGTKVIYYDSQRQPPVVKAVVACSPADLSYENRVRRVNGFQKVYERSEQCLDEGKGEELIRLPAPADWASDTIFTAKTLVDKYHRSSTNDAKRYVSNVKCPLLITAGSEENALQEYAKELQKAASNPRCTVNIIEGAGHFYRGQEERLVNVIDEWLGKSLPTLG